MVVNDNLEPGASRSDLIFNSAAVVAAAVGWQTAMAFMSLTTIIPVLLGHLGASNITVGALIALYNLFFSVSGLLVVRHVSKLPRAKWQLFKVALVERTALLPLAFLIPLWGVEHPKWAIGALFACIALHTVMMGMNQPAYWASFGKIIPLGRRGRLSGMSGALAGLSGLCVGYVLKRLLTGPNGGFPDAFGHLFLIGSVIFVLAAMPFAFFREPYRLPMSGDDPHAGHGLRDGLQIWRANDAFRRFLYAQVFMVLATLATPFFVLHAQRHLFAGPAMIAGYTAASVMAGAMGSLIGGVSSDRVGNRAVLVTAIIGILLANVCALVIASQYSYYIVFVLSSMSLFAFGLASNNMVIEFAPQSHDIPIYMALNNLVMVVPRVAAPLLGGYIADSQGDWRLFTTAIVLAVTGLTLILKISEPRHQYRNLSEVGGDLGCCGVKA